jgi:hypothetical protein
MSFAENIIHCNSGFRISKVLQFPSPEAQSSSSMVYANYLSCTFSFTIDVALHHLSDLLFGFYFSLIMES